jgi:alkylation response protein AidB-like acyl-CoA dehydrogenase
VVSRLLNDRDVRFVLYEFLNVGQLLSRPRYRHHSTETFDEVLDTARTLAQRHFADHYASADVECPVFEAGSVRQLVETKAAWDAFADAGFFAAKYDVEDGGIQLPEPVYRAAISYFCAANIATAGYMLLNAAAIALLRTFGSAIQKARYVPPMLVGRFAGTMAMTEPNQGSSLADISTTAERSDDGTYRIRGQKIFISGGDQAITDNIVHMVLARIKGAAPGTKGISLFICPKYLVNDDGSLGDHNDVRLMGLLHKMGYHNTTSTLLAFGDGGGAIGYLVGEEHHGLKYMFHMMNESRIAVGTGAAALAYQGFNYSLAYARERVQGRLPSDKNPNSQQVKIIQHADVRRMLLAQKSYAEGGLALCLLAAALSEECVTGESQSERQDAHALLDLLTPIVKSWPSKYGVRSNDLAIQVLGGSGYTKDHPVEQYFRDQRLNPIHEGVEAIHALDLLGRKVWMQGRHAFKLLCNRVREDASAAGAIDSLECLARAIVGAIDLLAETTEALSQTIEGDINLGLANATLYLHVFGHIVVGWIWLQQAACAARCLADSALPKDERDFYLGKVQTARYFIEWELPRIGPLAQLLRQANAVCFDMQEAWF